MIAQEPIHSRASNLSGTWSTEFPDRAHNDYGSLRGTSLAHQLLLELVTSADTPGCRNGGSLAVSAVVQGTQLAGSWMRFDCDAVRSGSVDLLKTD